MFRWLKQKFSSQAPGAVESPPMALERHAGDGGATASIAGLQAGNDLNDWLARGREALADGDYPAAVRWHLRAVSASPNDANLRVTLGFALIQLRDFAEAKRHLNRAILLAPENANAFYLLGRTAHKQGDLSAAIENFSEALQIKPDFEVVFGDWAAACIQLGQVDEAKRIIEEGISRFPDSPDLQYRLGTVQVEAQEYELAIASYRNALAKNPGYPEAHHFLGQALAQIGEVDQAIQSVRRGLAFRPGDLASMSSLLWLLSFQPDHLAARYLLEARRYGETVKALARPYRSWRSSRRDDGEHTPLRIGLVSGDFWAHPVGLFLEGALTQLDRKKFALHAYSMNRRDDAVTSRLKACCATWTSILEMNDAEAARRIHDDGIDILIDLSGHSGYNRLPLFAWKPAPAQVSWLGFLASTGVPGMDFVLADPIAVPESNSDQFTEEVWRLPETFNCLTPPGDDNDLPVAEPPVVRNGYITFGSFQRINKLSDTALALWARVLHEVPGAKLLLRNQGLGCPEARTKLLARMAFAGIDVSRVVLRPGILGRIEYLTSYSEVDIALDTLPYRGTTTTCEALWMGVPTITLGGQTMLGRVGASLMTCAGLGAWVSWSEEEFIKLAVKHATNTSALVLLRAGLRRKLAGSALFDASRFARQFEHAMLGIWAQLRSQAQASDGEQMAQPRAIRVAQGVDSPAGAETPAMRARQAVSEGNLALASHEYRLALERDPANGDLQLGLAYVLIEQGHFANAMPCLESALGSDPENPDTHYLLSRVARSEDNLELVIKHLERARALNPDFEFALRDLARALFECGYADRAVQVIEDGLRRFPESADFHYYLGNIKSARKDYEGAIASYQNALLYEPDYAEVHYNIGHALIEARCAEQALPSLDRALAINPDYVEAHNNRGYVMLALKKYDAALESHRSALRLSPQDTDALHNIGYIHMDMGHVQEAMESFRKVLAIKPDYYPAHNSLLWLLSFQPSAASGAYIREARHFGEKVAALAKPYNRRKCREDRKHLVVDAGPQARLRVGLVSGDFRLHPVGFFLEGVLANLNPETLELFAYSMGPWEDALTNRVKPYFEHWTSITDLSDEEAAHRIYEDGVDVLIDLAGHSGYNRLPVFAWKPAPVQVSWLGYLASTGVPGMDYVIADPISAPAYIEDQFSEKLWRLPETFNCFTPPIEHPALTVTVPPALRNGYVTFGSFQRLNKVSDLTLAAWAKILHAMPGSRLRLQNPQIDNALTRSELSVRLQKAGIAEDRVLLNGVIDGRENHLAAHGLVDIILDTYPYPGTTTTCEALWMGVPTVAWGGETMLARVGASLMTCVGLKDWVAWSEEEYVALAIEHGSNIGKLARLRENLRAIASVTALFDARRFAVQLEDALVAMAKLSTPNETCLPPASRMIGMVDGVSVVTPDTLMQITPYVLEEQQDWFEDEIKFLRRVLAPGQHAIDIGANCGVYTFVMAKHVGPEGQVWAFEPATVAMALLTRGKGINGFRNLTLERSAVSDLCGIAALALHEDPEANSIADPEATAAHTESVRRVSLDECLNIYSWRRVDFLKIDAEGEESRIILGGKRFFSALSPLVQFEVRAGAALNLALVGEFAKIGYTSYRLVPGLNVLVPFDGATTQDGFLLNLFCCKPDCADRLAAAGFLLRPQEVESNSARSMEVMALAGDRKYDWHNTLARMPYGQEFAVHWADAQSTGNSDVVEALALHAVSQDERLAAALRFEALRASFDILRTLCERAASHLRLASLARVSREFGARSFSVSALQLLNDAIERQDRLDFSEPFLAPNGRFDQIPPTSDVTKWIEAAILEELERTQHFSSFYSGGQTIARLERIASLGMGSPEMARRLNLVRRRLDAVS